LNLKHSFANAFIVVAVIGIGVDVVVVAVVVIDVFIGLSAVINLGFNERTVPGIRIRTLSLTDIFVLKFFFYLCP